MKKRQHIIALCLLLLLGACTSKPTKLFNGTDLSNWSAWTRKDGRVENAEKCFNVEDNMIRMSGKVGGYLMTKEAYENYELTVTYRWNTDPNYLPQNDAKNSGVMYNVGVNEPDSWFPKGLQFQVKLGGTGDFILLKNATLRINEEQVGPGKSVVSPRLSDREKPAGEWNTMRIYSYNGTIRQTLNGVVVNEGTDCSETSGRILLCYENAPIDFKDILLTKL